MVSEVAFWFALVFSYQLKDSYLQSSRYYASEFASADSDGKSERFLEQMQNYRAYNNKAHRSDSYEEAQILSGKSVQEFDIVNKESNYWDFGSSSNPENTENWRRYRKSLNHARQSQVAMNFAIGALLLNRVFFFCEHPSLL